MKKRLGLIVGMAFLIASAMPALGDGIPDGFSFRTINFPGNTFTQLLGYLTSFLPASVTANDFDSGANNSQATGISDKGWVSGFYMTNGGTDSFGFLLNGTKFTSLQFPGSTFTQALGVNDNGEVVGFYVDSSGATHGFVYENGQYASFGDPLGVGMTTINGVDDLGQIVGFYGPGGNIDNGFLGSPAPETGTLFLLGTGLLGVGVLVRRKTQGKSERL